MQEIRRKVERAGERDDDVLITGDCGTGKDLVARAIHAAAKRRGAFLRVEGAAPPGALDTQLFGARAAGSTLFVHEIAALPPAFQAQLRLAIEERDKSRQGPLAGVRLLASTSQDLEEAVEKGTFDRAFYEHLAGEAIHLPPLNARREDVPILLAYFLDVLREETGHQVESFSPTAVEVLMRRTWVGNVRELHEYVRTTVELCTAKVVEPEDLWIPRSLEEPAVEPYHLGYRVLRKRVLLQFEADFVTRVLKASSGNVSMAARLAKIDRKHLWRLIQRTGIRLDRFGKNMPIERNK